MTIRSPGDRIRVIKRIAQDLSEQSWPEIDLTLRQFGFPWTDSWSGTADDRYGYVLDMIQGGSDDDLDLLAAYFDDEAELPATEHPSHWRDGFLRLFVSHLASERAFVHDVKVALSRYGIDAFVAHDDIIPTREWEETIRASLASCDALVALLHPGFRESNWCDQEVGVALGRGRFVMSVRLGMDPYGFLGRYQGLPGGAAEPVAEAILDALLAEKTTRSQVADGLIAALEAATSYAQAKTLTTRIGQLPQLEGRQAERLLGVLGTNDQVSGAWGVPERITSIARRHGVSAPTEP